MSDENTLAIILTEIRTMRSHFDTLSETMTATREEMRELSKELKITRLEVGLPPTHLPDDHRVGNGNGG